MIGLLGMRRIILLTVLLVVAGLLGAGVYLYVIPQTQDLERDLRVTRAKISQKQNEVADMRERFDELKMQQVLYTGLKDAGLFNEQNRVWAIKSMDKFKKLSHVLNTEYKGDSAAVVERDELRETGYLVLDSKVAVNLDAMDDMDIYNFIYWIENAFPGHTSITKLDMRRVQEISQNLLREIGSGKKRVLVKADVEFSWKTLSPKETVLGDDEIEGGEY